uniref:Uncharacterized protein n=1 Tax=viral metagenome TaxID=1070528 RepID=A0A6C0BLY1_9ZZZZ
MWKRGPSPEYLESERKAAEKAKAEAQAEIDKRSAALLDQLRFAYEQKGEDCIELRRHTDYPAFIAETILTRSALSQLEKQNRHISVSEKADGYDTFFRVCYKP